jgi:tape measure domain-containing protein
VGNKVSFIIQLQDRFSRQAEKVRRVIRAASDGFDKFGRKAKAAGQVLQKVGKQAKAAGKKISSMGSALTTRVTLPLVAFGGVALVQSAKLETLATSFETMTGSAEKGQKLLQQLTEFTATTPFQLEGVAKATKTLLAFKVPLDEMPGTLRMLGDIAAGTDAPLSDIAQIFGKARAKGKLMTEELLQLAERGIPVIDAIADKFGITKAQVFKLASESKISFAVMEDALKGMTKTGGIFFNQTKRQSETLAGVFSTLKDNIGLTSGVFGDIIVDVFGLTDGIAGLNEFFTELRGKIQAFAKESPTITKLVTIFVALLAALGPILFVVGQAVVVFGALTVIAGALGISFSAMVVPVLLAVAAAGLLIAAGVLIIQNWEGIKGGAKALWEDVSMFFSRMVDSVVQFGSAVVNSVLSPFREAKAAISELGAFAGSVFGFGDTEIKSEQTINRTSQTDVNVNLRAPERAVESIKTKTSGKVPGLNVGINMMEAGL